MKQMTSQIDFYNKLENYSAAQTNQSVDSTSFLRTVARGERAAVKNCIDNYGNLIWAMVKKVTHSTEDAEAVTREIFLNIWRYAARFEQTNFDELLFITVIARRQLRKYKVNQSIN